MTIVAQTPRLVIRPWTDSDAELDRIFDAYSRMEVVRYLGSFPNPMSTRAQARTALDRWTARCTPDGRYGVWGVQVRDTGVMAGTVLLVPLMGARQALASKPDEQGMVEVGWHFHPDSWGHGYATEAAAAVLRKGFADGLAQIYAVVRPENEPSLNVCRRLGMTHLGQTNRWYDSVLEQFRLDAPG